MFLGFWQRHAAREVKRLEKVLVAALGSTVARYCELCQRSMLSSDSFAEHVARDIGHMAQVQARFEHEGPSGRGWVQCWAGVAQLTSLWTFPSGSSEQGEEDRRSPPLHLLERL